MDGRTSTSWLLTVPLALLCGGCITTQTPNTNATQPASKTAATRTDDGPKITKREDGPKRNPQPATMIGLGKLKEADADSEAGKKNPEMQAHLRDEARQSYQFAIKLDPNNIEALRCLGKLYAKTGDFDRAFETFKKAMDKNPKDANLWYDLGLCHARRKDFSESIRCLTKAMELDPQNRDCVKMLGINLAWTGQVEQGFAHLVRIQGPAMAHYNIACMFDQKLQPERAMQHCRLARCENGELLEQARDLLASLESSAAPGQRGDVRTAVHRE